MLICPRSWAGAGAAGGLGSHFVFFPGSGICCVRRMGRRPLPRPYSLWVCFSAPLCLGSCQTGKDDGREERWLSIHCLSWGWTEFRVISPEEGRLHRPPSEWPEELWCIQYPLCSASCGEPLENGALISPTVNLLVVPNSLWPHDCSLPGSSVHRILQASILEWVAISYSRGSSLPRDRTRVSNVVDRFFTIWAPQKYTLLASPRPPHPTLFFVAMWPIHNQPLTRGKVRWWVPLLNCHLSLLWVRPLAGHWATELIKAGSGPPGVHSQEETASPRGETWPHWPLNVL